MEKKPMNLVEITSQKKISKNEPIQNLGDMAKRIPAADWMDNPALWDKKKFVKETAEYLYETYGMTSDQYKHTLSMLADHMDMYILCNQEIAAQGLIAEYNQGKTTGPNPHISIRNKCSDLIIALMGQLGLTPKTKLTASGAKEKSAIGNLLKGPKSA